MQTPQSGGLLRTSRVRQRTAGFRLPPGCHTPSSAVHVLPVRLRALVRGLPIIYCLTMKLIKGMAVTGALTLVLISLTGCTGAVTDAQPTAQAASAQPSPYAVDRDAIYARQQAWVAETYPSAAITAQSEGIGRIEVGVSAIAAGHATLGATVACTGSGQWKVKLSDGAEHWASGDCATDGGGVLSVQVKDAAQAMAVEATVDADAQIWLTTFTSQ